MLPIGYDKSQDAILFSRSCRSFDMKVVLVYRKSSADAYSIEEIFHTVAGEIRKYSEVVEYECGSRWNMFKDVWRLRNLRADVYHITGDINYLALLLPHKKTILTVHDIGHYLFGLSGWKRWVYKWLWLKLPARTVRTLTTVSMETRDNTVKHLGLAEDCIHVVENCHSPIFQYVPRQFNADCPAILQVGTKPYKNVPRLIEALQGIRCRLVLIGKLDELLEQKLAECGIDYENHVGLSHIELYKKYVDCDMVSFVSTGEGFGVPIIEAQACGRPLITANVSPMRDVAGDGACLVDPLDVQQIRNGIEKIIRDQCYRDKLVQSGLHNAGRYAPVAISARYFALYRDMQLCKATQRVDCNR